MKQPRALMVLTRDPGGELTGRKAVLATIASSLEAVDIHVDVVVLSRTPPPEDWQGRGVAWVRLPGLSTVAFGATGVALRGKRSFNEVLFDSRRVRREVRRVAAARGSSVVVADTLRTAVPAMATGLPVIVHFDDLLSNRYAELSSGGQVQGDVLGFFGGQLPAPVAALARTAARRLLSTEARLTAVREVQLAQAAAAAAMTSPEEAQELGRRAGRSVSTLPMAVDVRPTGDVAGAPGHSMVFLGHLGYAPNMAALEWWRDEVRPLLDAQGGEDIVLTVVGSCSMRQRDSLEDARLRFTGYLPDLADELRAHRAMVAPVTSGTGMKTKVLDGFSVGLPVVATSLGVAGLAVRDGQEALVSDDPAGFAASVLRLRDDPAMAAAIGIAGRSLLRSTWSSETLVERWRQVIADVLTPNGAQGRSQPPV